MERTFVIGDIHGGLKALKQVLKRAQVTSQDKLLFLGDYVDGWSDSANTVRFLIELNSTHNCIFIRGNHDELCLNWLKTGKYNEQWLLHGGKSTIEAYNNLNRTEIALHLNFFENLENYYIDSKNRLFVHAGFTNERGVTNEYFPKMFYWDRTLWEAALALDKNISLENPKYPKRFLVYSQVFIGHTSLTRIGKDKPYKAANVWNLDTGAAYKQPLTIMNVDSEEFWQSAPVNTLYPNELGRN